jgi:CDP-6-deoxy-D-xylo-4-hexulose-3-dehydrase
LTDIIKGSARGTSNQKMSKAAQIKSEIFKLVSDYYEEIHAKRIFSKGITPVPVSGKVFDAKDIQSVVDSALDGWFTTGRFNDAFQKKLSAFIGVRHVLTVNSGSSANLVAISALTSGEYGDRALKAGDEVITVAASFPTTINPLLLYQLVPVFVDITIPTYNIDCKQIEQAVTEKTKAIVVAHTLGNPFNVDAVMKVAKKYDLWVVEDCCDALGATYGGKHVGTFGDVGTLSFYPAHHITMGEGGAVFTDHSKIKKTMESIRDWGRDCWCEPGKEDTCGKRFEWELGSLPFGYDHKYIYSRLGFNLKITDMQAALGLAQLEKLEKFIHIRRHNFDRLKKGLSALSHKLILPEPTENSNPSWFGFLISLKENCGVTRNDLIRHLSEKKIATRLLFGGDLTKQPYLKDRHYRIAGDLKHTNTVLRNTFWIGVTPMIDDTMIDYVVEVLKEYLQ